MRELTPAQRTKRDRAAADRLAVQKAMEARQAAIQAEHVKVATVMARATAEKTLRAMELKAKQRAKDNAVNAFLRAALDNPSMLQEALEKQRTLRDKRLQRKAQKELEG